MSKDEFKAVSNKPFTYTPDPDGPVVSPEVMEAYKERIDPNSRDLAQVMSDVSAFSQNQQIGKACYALIVAANELLPIRNEEKLRKQDMRYLSSALEWSDKARAILSDLAVELHES